MYDLRIKTCNLQKDSPNNAQGSELTVILWQDTMENSKSHLVLLCFHFSMLRQHCI